MTLQNQIDRGTRYDKNRPETSLSLNCFSPALVGLVQCASRRGSHDILRCKITSEVNVSKRSLNRNIPKINLKDFEFS